MRKAIRFRQNSQTEFVKVFRPLSERHSSWQAWADFVTLAAISIAAPFGIPDDERHKERAAEYQSIMSRYNEREQMVFSELFSLTVQALEENPEQDFLGEMFMALEMGNHWKGQFFTPYDLCKCMAKMTLQDVDARIEEKGWIGICDCCCGAGALLIAARNIMHFSDPPIGRLPGHLQTLFVCQDIDRTAALMCYIQLSLLGCAGYVVVGNALTHPLVGFDNNPVLPIETEGQEIWCMPMFHDQVWVWRQTLAKMEALFHAVPVPAISDNPQAGETGEIATESMEASLPLPPPMEPEPEQTQEFSVTAAGQLTLF